MLKKTKFLLVFVLSLVLSVAVLKSFDANSIIRSAQFDLSSIDLKTSSNKTNKTIDDFRSKIQRPKYNVNCRQIFEMNKVNCGVFKLHNKYPNRISFLLLRQKSIKQRKYYYYKVYKTKIMK
jgi:hypothetical protein